MTRRLLYLSLAALLLPLGLSAQTVSFKYAAINVPTAAQTMANGINNKNLIVGSYISSAGHTHGFTLSGTTFTTVDFPKSTSTNIYGVNDNGDVVGSYTLSGSMTSHGFLRHNGVFSTIDFPGPSGTAARGINNSGVIVGAYDNSHGFVLKSGVFTTLDAPTNGSPDTQLNAISNLGVIVGQVFSFDDWRGFWKTPSELDFLAPPASRDNQVNGVNSRTDIVGCHDSNLGFLALAVESNEPAESSEGSPHTFTVNYPGSNNNTCPMSINWARSIVGSYLDSSFHSHGFLATTTVQ